MLLHNLLKNNPSEVFIYLERRMNNENHPANVAEKYSAMGNSESFELPFVLMDPEEIEVLKSFRKIKRVEEMMI